MTPSAPAHEPGGNRKPIFVGGPLPPPTPEEAAAFERALAEANARFLAAALAEDGMPISAGWRGPVAQPQSPPPTAHPEAPIPDGIASTPG